MRKYNIKIEYNWKNTGKRGIIARGIIAEI